MIKICTLCKQEKDINEFTRRKVSRDGFNSACKACTRKKSKMHYESDPRYYVDKNNKRRTNIRKYIRKIKNQSICEKCGESDYICLDFHHQNREKDVEIAHLYQHGWCKDRIDRELSKCKILCANCHRKFHRDEMKNMGIYPLATNQLKG